MNKKTFEMGNRVYFDMPVENSKYEVKSSIRVDGYVAGVRLAGTSERTIKEYWITKTLPGAYHTPKSYGWKRAEELEKIDG